MISFILNGFSLIVVMLNVKRLAFKRRRKERASPEELKLEQARHKESYESLKINPFGKTQSIDWDVLKTFRLARDI